MEKVRRIKKRPLKLFFASAFVTALVIAFAAAMIFVEANTSKTGLKRVSTPFSAGISEDKAEITVNDRDYVFSIKPIFEFLESHALTAAFGAWLLI